MSAVLEEALTKLNEKLAAKGGLGVTLKFDLTGEGCIVINDDKATIGDGDAQCTIKLKPNTFMGLLDGTKNPTTAFMMGKIKVDGDMGVALKLSKLAS